MPRARLNTADGKTTEWKSQALRAYQRRTLAADALIAGTYLAGTNTRRVRRALRALFGGAVGKDTVSRVWRRLKSDWEAWNARFLADEPIVRLAPRKFQPHFGRHVSRRNKAAEQLSRGKVRK
jgi:transposase-like protein